jgi:hypothetical protein
MPLGTNDNFESTKNFPLLGTVYSEDLHIKIELGRLAIAPRNLNLQGKVAQSILDNIYYPNPGNKQGSSFVNPDVSQIISNTLSSIGHGIIPGHIDISGAPYCTFLDISMSPGETHPYYNLIVAPTDVNQGNINYSDAIPFFNNQQLQNNFNIGNYSQVPGVSNILGPVNIPATTYTETEVSNLLTAGKIKPLTSYNFWTVENINPNAFTYVQYLGYQINNGLSTNSSSTVLQPYAYVLNNNETAEITAIASNSLIILTRKYPIAQDYAVDPNAMYYYYNNSNNGLSVKNIGLSNGNTPVGFTIKFSNVVTVASQNTYYSTTSGSFIKKPEIFIQWGDFDFFNDSNTRDKYISQGLVGLYTLYINSTDTPKLYYNISNQDIVSGVVNPNTNNTQLKTFSKLNVGSKNSNEKVVNDFEIYVFYSGQYLYIGNNSDPHSWQQIGQPVLKYKNFNSNTTFNHYLDNKSQIQIIGKFCNFTFQYGPPLFSPFDQNNTSQLTNQTPVNSLNFFANQCVLPTESVNEITANADPTTVIPQFIQKNALFTFQNAGESTNNYIGGASAYLDIRSVSPNFVVGVEYQDQSNGQTYVQYKITFPSDLGGHVFTKFVPPQTENTPSISDTYVLYDIMLSDDSTASHSVSDILTEATKSITVTKSFENDGAAIIGGMDITFVNLNRSTNASTNSFDILQFMRKNIAVLRLSAGFGENLNVFFEGAIKEYSINESLGSTEIQFHCEDLLEYLFKNPKTMLISRTALSFPGMTFQNILNALVDSTELKNHFQYDLGVPLQTFLDTNPNATIPKVLDSGLLPTLAELRVVPYSTQNSYYSVLKIICQLTIISNLITNSTYNQTSGVTDASIMYWYTDEQSDGIVFSSRMQYKDEDKFYFRQSSINTDLTTNIQAIHGYLVGSEGNDFSFKSTGTTENLFYEGIYFYLDPQQRQKVISVPTGALQAITDLIAQPPVIGQDSPSPYIGYDKIVVFSDESKPGEAGQLNSLVLPKDSTAQDRLNTWFKTFCSSVYETIELKVYVTQPLKEWGHFRICVEDTVPITERYLYSSVQYTFNIFENTIVANIKGARNPVIDA